MTASNPTPRSGESVTDAQSAQRAARNDFLEANLQLIRDRLVWLKNDLDELEDADIRYELHGIRTELKAIDSMVAGSESGSRDLDEDRRWCCRFCGNVVALQERPTECYHCRRGESELQLNDDRLFVELEE